MKPKVRSRTSCLFCWKSCHETTPFPSGEILGAVRCSELEKQLQNIFILRQLLDIPSSWCEEALQRGDGGCNPDSWFRICSGCMNMVTDAWCIYQKLLDLEDEMKSIKEGIRNVMKENIINDRRIITGGIDCEIRSLVFPDFIREIAVPSPETMDNTFNYNYNASSPESTCSKDFQVEVEALINEDKDEDSPSDFDDNDKNFMQSRKPSSVKKRRRRVKLSNSKKTIRKPRKGRKTVKTPVESKLCTLCPSKFRTKFHLDAHKTAHEESKQDGGLFDCDICSFPGRSVIELNKHKLLVHVNTSKLFSRTYSCNKCDFTTEAVGLLKSHVEKEHADVPEEELGEDLLPLCSICNKRFTSFRGVVSHQKLAHPEMFGAEKKAIHCDQCELLFPSKLHLQYHVNKTHLRVNSIICDICGKGFNLLRKLTVHKLCHQKEKREYVCDICGIDYLHQSNLDGHYNKFHSKPLDPNAKPFECKYCEITSPYKPVMIRHMQKHKIEMGIQCDICQKYYTNVNGLRLHKQINHSETNEQFTCPYCLKPFPALPNLKTHIAKYCKLKGLTNDNDVKPISSTVQSTSVVEPFEISTCPNKVDV